MSKNLIVVKSNNFVEASYKLTLDEMRILLLTIGKIDPNVEEHHRDFEFTVAEFAESFGIDEKVAYQQVQTAVDKLGGRWAVLEDTPKIKHKAVFLTDQTYFKGEGRFQIVLHEKLMPFVSAIKDKFTKYNLEYVAKFSSFHAIRLYEILAQYRSVGWREVDLKELKEWLQIADKYERWDNFKQWLLKPSITEINEKSDLVIEFEPIKRGRAIVALRFTINKKKLTDNVNSDLTKDGLTKLPQRPQVKAGSDAEWQYWRECLRIRNADYARFKADNIRRPTKLLEDLEKYYRKLGDTLRADELKEVIERRKQNGKD